MPASPTALSHDEWIVVEEGVTAREIEVAVLGHTTTPRASVPGEIVPGADFYDYDDKYADGAADLRVPAPLPDEVAEEARRLACRVFRAYRAEGMARVDFLYEEGGRGLLLNELNTIPGFTPDLDVPDALAGQRPPVPGPHRRAGRSGHRAPPTGPAPPMSTSSSPSSSTVLLDRLAFPDCPRWHDGRLWFSDSHDGRVWAMTQEGQAEPAVAVEGRPGGLGWLPDGRLLVVSMLGRALLRLDEGGLVTVCDLSRFSPHPWNELVVDPDGRAYVGCFGHDIEAGDEPAGAPLVCVEPDGEAWVVVDRMLFPNGSVVVDGPDGRTLIVAETWGQRLSAYDLLPDGSAARPRVWADLRPNVPDGLAVDAEGAVWVADPVLRGLMRVVEGVGAVEWIPTGDHAAYACTLGGSDGRTLYVCTSETSNPSRTVRERSGRIEAVRVDVPGVV